MRSSAYADRSGSRWSRAAGDLVDVAVRAEDLVGIAVGEVEDREVRFVDPGLQLEHIYGETHHVIETVGRTPEPADAFDLHVTPPRTICRAVRSCARVRWPRRRR